MWDKKFAKSEYLYGTKPNVYLAEIIDTLAPGSCVLFLGEGEGRNACYAASKSLDVTAIDGSKVALEKLDKLSNECQVQVEAIHLDLADWSVDKKYDAVLCSYLHLEDPLRTEVFVKALNSLKLGGVFAGEFFATTQLDRDSGGPKDLKLLYTANDFLKLKRPGYVCKSVESVSVELDEGKGHVGLADVIRVCFYRNELESKVSLDKLTLKDLLESSVQKYSNSVAFKTLDGSCELTYQEFGSRVSSLQQELKDSGVKSGDRVVLCSENMPYWGVVYFAVTTMGAVIVPILPDFHANEIRHIILHSECVAIFISQRLRDALDHDSMSGVATLFCTNDLKKDSSFTLDESRLQKLRSAMKKEIVDKKSISEDDLCAIIYTSGTTGSSKGVMLTHRALTFQALATDTIFEMKHSDRLLSILPLAHTYECSIGFLAPFANGSSVTYIDKVPTPKVLIGAMAQVKPTIMLSVPLIIEKIFKNRVLPNFQKNFIIRALYKIGFVRKKLHTIAGKKLIDTFGSELGLFGIGGAPLSPFVESFLQEASFPYCIGYGLTESAPLLTGEAPFSGRLGSVGRVLDGVEIRFEDVNSAGEGTIWVRGPNIMLGYFKAPEKSAEVLDSEGWLNTEDLGYLDDDGYLFISGRSKNMILSASGENIYPEQIEAIVSENTLVEDVLVYAQEKQLIAKVFLSYEKIDEKIGIKNLTESQAKAKVEELLESIRVEANGRVSKFSKITKVIEQKEEFVKTPTKKIKRYLYTS